MLPGESTVGGGSLPGSTLPTSLLALSGAKADSFLQRLREGTPPVIARVAGGRVLLDPRTVLPEQDTALLDALRAALT